MSSAIAPSSNEPIELTAVSVPASDAEGAFDREDDNDNDNRGGEDEGEDAAAFEYDVRGLPEIPRGAPKYGDRIDVDRIQAEFHTRATKRTSPAASGAAYGAAASSRAASSNDVVVKPASGMPLRTVTTSAGVQTRISRPGEEEDDDDADEDETFNADRYDEIMYNPTRAASRGKLPKKAAFTAGFLLFVGILFTTLGLSFLFTLGASEALPFLIIGGIGLIPGTYVSFIMYQAWKGVPGYSYDQIPTYDD